ncbi:MAG: hypothetical protein JW782_02525 [Candidatus Saganbacteria bacterium]|nr:hypothetical protein [Candidatus Saganbacteria bacterium]
MSSKNLPLTAALVALLLIGLSWLIISGGMCASPATTTLAPVVSSTTTTATTATTSTTAASSTTTSSTTTTTLAEAQGVIDPSFGASGIVEESGTGGGDTDAGADLLVDGNGRIVVAGTCTGPNDEFYMTVWAYDSSGARDSSFGSNGVLLTNSASPGVNAYYGCAITRDAANNYYIAGYAQPDDSTRAIVVWKVSPNGALDSSFGNNGALYIDSGTPGAMAYGIALDASDNIYVAGLKYGPEDAALLMKLDSTGQIDTSFGANGYANYQRKGFDNLAYDVVVDSSGRIYIVGHYVRDNNLKAGAIWRINSNGTYDASFGSSGVVILETTYNSAWSDIDIDASGKLVVAGYEAPPSSRIMYLARYTTTGVLDTSFNSIGYATYSGRSYSVGSSLAFNSLNKIVVGGYAGSTQDLYDYSIWRFTNSGALDTSFSTAGLFTADLGGSDRALSIVIDGSNRLLVTGVVEDGTKMDLLRVK